MTHSIHASRTSRSLCLQALAPAALVLPLVFIAGCGGGGDAPPPEEPPGPEPTVQETLETLGIDTTVTPRLDEAGDPLPTSFTPLGQTYELQKLSELVVCGIVPESAEGDLSLFGLQIPAGETSSEAELLHVLSDEETPWASESIDIGFEDAELPRSWRSIVGADVDGDGRQEIACVYVADSQLHLYLIEDQEAEFGATDSILIEEFTNFVDVTAAVADLDGDGDDELLVGYTILFDSVLVIVDRGETGFEVLDEPSITFAPTQPNSVFLLDIETGNLDYDGPQEFALVANEYSYEPASVPDAGPGAGDGANTLMLGSTWYVYDDAATGLALIASGVLEELDETEVLQTALVADVGLGDLDADGIDEIVLGGISDPGGFCSATYVLRALDDAAHALAPLAATVSWSSIQGCETVMRWAHVGTVDLQGDHASEIYVNDRLFYDLPTAGGFAVLTTLPQWAPFMGSTDTATTAMVVGDFTGDGRENVVYWEEALTQLRVWGIPADDPDQEPALMHTVDTVQHDSYSAGTNPLLVAVNPDSDSTILEFIEHEYVFTEPIVLAALAAPPCEEGIGQDVGACNTEFGNEQSQSSGSEWDFHVSASFIIGTELLDLGNGWDIEAKLTAEYGHTWSNTYETTTSMAFATGPLEDTVVATVTPYDHYRYRIINDPFEENIGEIVEVMIPRKVITLQTEREFFNDAVRSTAVRIDQSVFDHTPGALSSYPGHGHFDAFRDDESARFLEHGPVGVGQGSGTTTLGLAFATEEGGSDYLNGSFEFEATTTIAAIKIGGSFGIGGGHTWSWTVGESTSYSGTVGSIDAEHFAAHHYNFGIAAYWQQDDNTNQRFQVINYWVE